MWKEALPVSGSKCIYKMEMPETVMIYLTILIQSFFLKFLRALLHV